MDNKDYKSLYKEYKKKYLDLKEKYNFKQQGGALLSPFSPVIEVNTVISPTAVHKIVPIKTNFPSGTIVTSPFTPITSPTVLFPDPILSPVATPILPVYTEDHGDSSDDLEKKPKRKSTKRKSTKRKSKKKGSKKKGSKKK
jgi:hypothetical protein